MPREQQTEEVGRVLTSVYTDPVVWLIMIAAGALGFALNSWAVAIAAVSLGSVVYLGGYVDVS